MRLNLPRPNPRRFKPWGRPLKPRPPAVPDALAGRIRSRIADLAGQGLDNAAIRRVVLSEATRSLAFLEMEGHMRAVTRLVDRTIREIR